MSFKRDNLERSSCDRTSEENAAHLRHASSEEEDRKPKARTNSSHEDERDMSGQKRKRVISALQESKWQSMYQKLRQYQKKVGDCLVPNRYTGDPSLGAWGK